VNDEVFSKMDIWHSPAGRRAVGHAQPVRPSGPDAVQLHLAAPAGGAASGSPGRVQRRPAGPRRAADRYSIAVTFAGLFKATTDVHLFHNGRSLFAAQLNIGGNPNETTHKSELALGSRATRLISWSAGETATTASDSTALTADDQICQRAARHSILAADFPREKNPAEALVLRLARAGRQTRSGKFALYTESRYKSPRGVGQPGQSGLCRMGRLVAESATTTRACRRRRPRP